MTSEHILREVEENLTLLGIKPEGFVQSLRERMEVTDQFVKLPVGLPLEDEEDRQALAESIGAQCDVFLTFNSRDFGALYGQKVLGVLIHHPAEFWKLLG